MVTHSRLFILGALCAVLMTGLSFPAFAQNPAATYASSIANNCLSKWKTLKCYVAISDSTQVLTANYMAKLKTAGRNKDAENIRQQCAAASAVRKYAEQGGKEIPVNAMSESLTVCINQMYDTISTSSIQPDMDHYQLLLVPTLCLRGDTRCRSASQSLQPYLSKR